MSDNKKEYDFQDELISFANKVRDEEKKEEKKKKKKEKKEKSEQKNQKEKNEQKQRQLELEQREKEEQEKLQMMYDKLMGYENMLHEKNQKRIKIGIKCIFIIPLIFMFLMFTTGSSKVIFLAFWIVSLFGIAVYLICVEYVDYNLQEKMHEISGVEESEVETLLAIPEAVEERAAKVVEIPQELEVLELSEDDDDEEDDEDEGEDE